MILAMLVLGALCALADRYSTHRAPGDPLPVSTAAWAAAIAFVGFLFAGWAAVTFAMAWFGWRLFTPGVKPVAATMRGFLGAFRHHVWLTGGCVLAALVTAPSMLVTGVTMACWAAAAAGISACLHKDSFDLNHDGDSAPELMLARGAAFGVCLAMVAHA